MLKGLRVLFFMIYHFIVNTKGRNKYRVDNKELDPQTQRIYAEKIYRIMQSFCRGMVKSSGSKVVIKGKENLPKEPGNLYVANHRGFFDGMVIGEIIDDPCIFLGKDGINKMPIVRTWFASIGSIYITREDPRQSLVAIRKGIEVLKNKQSMVVFPEGTRTKTGEMGEFKAGTFKLAFASGAKIVPIAIKNTECIFENNNKLIKSATVYVNIGVPKEVKDLSKKEQKEVPKEIENYVQELFNELP